MIVGQADPVNLNQILVGRLAHSVERDHFVDSVEVGALAEVLPLLESKVFSDPVVISSMILTSRIKHPLMTRFSSNVQTSPGQILLSLLYQSLMEFFLQ